MRKIMTLKKKLLKKVRKIPLICLLYTPERCSITSQAPAVKIDKLWKIRTVLFLSNVLLKVVHVVLLFQNASGNSAKKWHLCWKFFMIKKNYISGLFGKKNKDRKNPCVGFKIWTKSWILWKDFGVTHFLFPKSPET